MFLAVGMLPPPLWGEPKPGPPFGLSSVRSELTAEGRVEDWTRIFKLPFNGCYCSPSIFLWGPGPFQVGDGLNGQFLFQGFYNLEEIIHDPVIRNPEYGGLFVLVDGNDCPGTCNTCHVLERPADA